MARRKRNSSTLERSDRRAESLRSLDAQLDFGNGLNLPAYTNSINDLRHKLATYNTALSTIDKLASEVADAEKLLTTMSENMLLGVASRYGKTSTEYEMAGGSRRKSQKRSTSRPTPTGDSVPTATLNGANNGATTATVS